MGTSQRNPVATRNHVEAATDHDVVQLGLRQKHGQLTLDRNERLVTEEIPCAEAGAIHNDRFRECEEMARTNIPLFFGNRYAQSWWEGSKMRPILPNWMDAEIKALDPGTELQRIESVKDGL